VALSADRTAQLTSRYRRREHALPSMPGTRPASDLERWSDCSKDEATISGIHDLCLPINWLRRSQQETAADHTALTL